jgi:hypothetical protein
LRVWGEERPMREFSEIIGSTFGGSKGRIRSAGGGSSSIREKTSLLLRNILKHGHKNILFLTLVPWKIFYHHNYRKEP